VLFLWCFGGRILKKKRKEEKKAQKRREREGINGKRKDTKCDLTRFLNTVLLLLLMKTHNFITDKRAFAPPREFLFFLLLLFSLD
jgi:hypothetical protein|tara:strand:- start:4414 stop:4668 length:255 start_codon:yes stop_codon:yes gene_type:complete